MKKRILAFTLALLMILSLMPTMALADTLNPDNDGVYHITSLDDLKAFRGSINDGSTKYTNMTISIDADIDMTGDVWTPIDAYQNGSALSGATINGNGHKIIGMKVSVEDTHTSANDKYTYGVGFISIQAGTLTVKDLEFVNADVSAPWGSQVGVVCGMTYGNMTLNNVDLTNCTVLGDTKTGALIGQNDEGSPNDIINCDLKGTVVKANYSSALMVGLLNTNSDGAVFTNCTADLDSKFVWVATDDFTEKGVLINGRYYGISGNQAMLTDAGATCWSERRVSGAKVTYNGVNYDVIGSAFVDGVAAVNGVAYKTLTEALNVARDAGQNATSWEQGVTIELLSDVEVYNTHALNGYGALQFGALYTGNYTTFNGNGHTLKLMGYSSGANVEDYYAINFSSCTEKLLNLTVDANNLGKSAINIVNSTVILENVTVVNVKDTWSAFGVSGSTANLINCKAVDGVKQVISVAASSDDNNAVATIVSGTYDGTVRIENDNNANATLNIQGGKFTFENTNGELKLDVSTAKENQTLTMSITGGYFTTDPSKYVAEGYAAFTSDNEGYTFMILPAKPAVEEEDITVPGNADLNTNYSDTVVTDVNDKLSEEAKSAPVTQEEELAKANVTGVADAITDEAKTKLIIDAIARIPKEEAEKLTEEDVVRVDVVIDSKLVVDDVTPVQDDYTVLKELVYEVKPVALVSTYINNTQIGDTESVYIENTDFIPEKQSFNVTLPCKGLKPVCIVHEEGETVINVFNKGEFVENDNDTVTVTISQFSTLTILNKVDPRYDYAVQLIAADGATVLSCYKSFAEAANLVKNGQTILLLKDCTEGAEYLMPLADNPTNTFTFSIDYNGHSFKGTILPDEDYSQAGGVVVEGQVHTYKFVKNAAPDEPDDDNTSGIFGFFSKLFSFILNDKFMDDMKAVAIFSLFTNAMSNMMNVLFGYVNQ